MRPVSNTQLFINRWRTRIKPYSRLYVGYIGLGYSCSLLQCLWTHTRGFSMNDIRPTRYLHAHTSGPIFSYSGTKEIFRFWAAGKFLEGALSLSLAPIVATNGHFVLTSASIGQFGCMQDLVSVTVETTAFVSTHVSVTAIENTSFNRASSFLVPLLRFMLKRIK